MPRKITATKPEKDQLKLWVEPEVIDRLKEAAGRAGGTLTHNAVALEIILRFLPAWEKLEQLQQLGVQDFIEQLGRAPIEDEAESSSYLNKETNEGIGDLYRPPLPKPTIKPKSNKNK